MANNNEQRLKAAGLRMALKLIPPDLMQKAPEHLEGYMRQRLQEEEPERHEAGVCYLIAPDANDGHLRVMTVTLDEENAVHRIIRETTIAEIFNSILENMKEL